MKTLRLPKMLLPALACTVALASYLFMAEPATAGAHKESAKDTAVATVAPVADPASMRLQGEQRFHANCGRCHATPQKFSPRVMATVVRHMRVRATITDADMRLILGYMTQ